MREQVAKPYRGPKPLGPFKKSMQKICDAGQNLARADADSAPWHLRLAHKDLIRSST